MTALPTNSTDGGFANGAFSCFSPADENSPGHSRPTIPQGTTSARTFPWADAVGLAGIIAVWIWLYDAWYVFTHRFYYFTNDTIQFFFPEFTFFARNLQQGIFPWRNPYLGLGELFPARFLITPFSPMVWLIAYLFPPFAGYALASCIFPLIGAFGAYALARHSGLAPEYSFLVGISLLGSGFFQIQRYHQSFIQPLAYLPWLMVFLMRWHERPTLGSFGGWVAIIALMMLGGFPQMLLYCALFAGIFSIGQLIRARGKFRWMLWLALGIEIGIALGNIQLVSALSVFGQGVRQIIVPSTESAWELIFNRLKLVFLFLSPLPLSSPRIKAIGWEMDHLTPSVFALSPLLPIIPMAIWFDQKYFRDSDFKRICQPFAEIFFSLWILYPLLPHVSFLKFFNYPSRIMATTHLALAIMLGSSIKLMIERTTSPGWRRQLLLGLAIVATLGYHGKFRNEELSQNPSVAIPEFLVGHPLTYAQALPDSQIIDFLASPTVPFRIAPFRPISNLFYDAGFFHLDVRDHLGRKFSRNLLPLMCGQALGITSIGPYGPGYHHALSPRRATRLIDRIYQSLASQQTDALLSLLNVRYILSREPLSIPGLQLVRTFFASDSSHLPLIENGPSYCYLNTEALPRAFVVANATATETGREILPVIPDVRSLNVNSLEIFFSTAANGDLLLSELDDPNWVVTRNDTPAPWYTALGCLMRIPGPFHAGDRLKLVYQPRFLGWSLAFAGLGILQIGLLVFFRGRGVHGGIT